MSAPRRRPLSGHDLALGKDRAHALSATAPPAPLSSPPSGQRPLERLASPPGTARPRQRHLSFMAKSETFRPCQPDWTAVLPPMSNQGLQPGSTSGSWHGTYLGDRCQSCPQPGPPVPVATCPQLPRGYRPLPEPHPLALAMASRFRAPWEPRIRNHAILIVDDHASHDRLPMSMPCNTRVAPLFTRPRLARLYVSMNAWILVSAVRWRNSWGRCNPPPG